MVLKRNEANGCSEKGNIDRESASPSKWTQSGDVRPLRIITDKVQQGCYNCDAEREEQFNQQRVYYRISTDGIVAATFDCLGYV